MLETIFSQLLVPSTHTLVKSNCFISAHCYDCFNSSSNIQCIPTVRAVSKSMYSTINLYRTACIIFYADQVNLSKIPISLSTCVKFKSAQASLCRIRICLSKCITFTSTNIFLHGIKGTDCGSIEDGQKTYNCVSHVIYDRQDCWM